LIKEPDTIQAQRRIFIRLKKVPKRKVLSAERLNCKRAFGKPISEYRL
jgi:hypothetical protein